MNELFVVAVASRYKPVRPSGFRQVPVERRDQRRRRMVRVGKNSHYLHDETVQAWARSRPPAERRRREAEQALQPGERR